MERGLGFNTVVLVSVATAKACAKIPDGAGEKEIFSADIKLFCSWSCAVVLGVFNIACGTFCSYYCSCKWNILRKITFSTSSK
jgi:hypothetical protein